MLPLNMGHIEGVKHYCIRYGTTTSFAALAIAPYRGLFPSPPLFDRMPTYRTQGKRSLNFLSAGGFHKHLVSTVPACVSPQASEGHSQSCLDT